MFPARPGAANHHKQLQTKTSQAYQTAFHGGGRWGGPGGFKTVSRVSPPGDSGRDCSLPLPASGSASVPWFAPSPPPVTGSLSPILPPSEPTPPPCHRSLPTALGPPEHQDALPLQTFIQPRLLGAVGGGVASQELAQVHPQGVILPWSEARMAENTSSPSLGNTTEEQPGETLGGGEPSGRDCGSAVSTPGCRRQSPEKPSQGLRRGGACPSRRRPGARTGRGSTPAHWGKLPQN